MPVSEYTTFISSSPDILIPLEKKGAVDRRRNQNSADVLLVREFNLSAILRLLPSASSYEEEEGNGRKTNVVNERVTARPRNK
jgi:hypothetical protein